MNWNRWIRQIGGWFSVIFTMAILINLIAVLRGKYTNLLGLMAVATLAFLYLSGLYLFVLPYAAKWHSARRTG